MPIHPLRTWLLEHQETQEEFASKVGVKQGYLSLIITGRRKPSRELARNISHATKRAVTIEQLLSFEIPAAVQRKPRGSARGDRVAGSGPIALPEEPGKVH